MCFKIGDTDATRCGKSWQAANSQSKSGSKFRKIGLVSCNYGSVFEQFGVVENQKSLTGTTPMR
jgi:hypothetical protein